MYTCDKTFVMDIKYLVDKLQTHNNICKFDE